MKVGDKIMVGRTEGTVIDVTDWIRPVAKVLLGSNEVLMRAEQGQKALREGIWIKNRWYTFREYGLRGRVLKSEAHINNGRK